MKRLLVLCFCAVLVSCEKNDVDLAPIDSKILIQTREVLGPNARKLTFFCQTEKIYTCANYQIATSKNEIESNAFDITFTSVSVPGICLTSTGPATALLDLGTVANGNYKIELNNANLKNTGRLVVTDTAIDLLFTQKNGIDFATANTKRVPPNTYWVSIGYAEASSSALVDEFKQKFANAGAVFSKQSPGDYFFYQIDAQGNIVANAENSGYYFLRAFIFQFDGDESALRNLVKVDGKQLKDTLWITLDSFKGETIYNWD